MFQEEEVEDRVDQRWGGNKITLSKIRVNVTRISTRRRELKHKVEEVRR